MLELICKSELKIIHTCELFLLCLNQQSNFNTPREIYVSTTEDEAKLDILALEYTRFDIHIIKSTN